MEGLIFEYREYIDDTVFYYIKSDYTYIGIIELINSKWCAATINGWALDTQDLKTILEFIGTIDV